jgi:AcrR family transcriptional regulator
VTSYSSPLRQAHAEETRRRIAEAALALFAERGYSGTAVADVAAAAGVAVQTIYATYGSKRKIVLGLVDAIDDLAEIAPLVERLAASADPGEVLRLQCAITRRFREGEAGEVVRVLFAAADTEPELARAAAEGMARHRRGAELAAGRLEELGALAAGTSAEQAAGAISLLTSHAAWRQLSEERGWSPDECEAWIVGALERLVLSGA